MTTYTLLLAALMTSIVVPANAAAYSGAVAVASQERVCQGTAARDLPYTAQQEFERQETLFDGNQIINKSFAASYRDSLGRTRQETLNSKGVLRRAVIMDIDGVSYELDPATKSAIKKRPYPGSARQGCPVPPSKATESAVGQTVKSAENKQEVQVRAPSNGVPNTQLVTLVADAFADKKSAGTTTNKDLGTRDIAGVSATGTLLSYQIPAGEQGNRKPMTVSHETWISMDLKIPVYTKTSDPRTGDYITRVTMLKRGEPSSQLFVVPFDYKIIELPPPVAN